MVGFGDLSEYGFEFAGSFAIVTEICVKVERDGIDLSDIRLDGSESHEGSKVEFDLHSE